jgi:chromate transporter
VETTIKRSYKDLIQLGFIFFKIGLFTFGGGLAMLPIMENEIVNKKQWITRESMLDLIAISESTPGVISLNAATFIGLKVKGFLGAIVATISVVLPSLIIIILISFVYDEFLKLQLIKDAFFGIRCVVALLIMRAALNMLIKMEKNLFSFLVLIGSCLIMVLTNISSIYVILGAGVISLVKYLILISIKIKKDQA